MPRLTGLFVLALVALPAAIPLVRPAMAAEAVTTFSLPNGMQAIVVEDHRAPVVVHMVWYKVGSADEKPGTSGIAHFLEHLMFKGTDKMASGEFSRVVEAQGGNDNAFTSYDYTGYFQRVAANRLDLMMQMEADRMRNLHLTEEEVTTERAVILEERNQRVENDPGSLLNEQQRAAQYLNHRYGIPVIGWRHEMEKLDQQDALAFYRTYYAPNNAILVVSGDVDPAEVKRLAEENYGPLKPSENLPPRIRPQEPPQIAARRVTLEDGRVARPYVMRTYLAPERNTGDQKEAAALTVLAELLGGDPATSVLGQKLQFETQAALSTGAFYDGVAVDPTTFGLYIVPAANEGLADAEAALDKALAEFMTEGVNAQQLERIKTQLRASDIYELDNVDRIARRYGEALSVGLTVEDVQAWPDALRAVTADDVMAAAHDVFDLRRSVTGWLTRPADAPEPPPNAPIAGPAEGDIAQ
ncbi:M16 family metallopeptidase [Haematobacter genomosp. 1]|uniref:Peptidase M16 n=1 Tax=Haematobacter genomosp. 1 TaxID=366618 RepID=A0A212AG40_9RHOB|nr:peptidase M16 [Haematobacter genomosp. 1]